MSEVEEFQKRLGYQFQEGSLLRLALTHPSVAHEAATSIQHNQRLEFLGDAVLGLVLTRELYEKFSEYGEGPLTKARAQMVNGITLAEKGRDLGIGEMLILSRGEISSGGRERTSALADAFEAVIGAIFLDGGFEAAQRFVLSQFADSLGEICDLPNLDNPKGELQEILQAGTNEAPRYEVISVTGPDHDRSFETAVFHQGIELGRGKGKTKKRSESEAAIVALQKIKPPEA